MSDVQSPSVLAIGPERFDIFIQGVSEEVRRRGWRFHRYSGDIEALAGDPRLAAADVLLVDGAVACDRALLSSSPELRAVVTPFIGTESIEEDAAAELGILICNGQIPENYEGVAEGTILLILAATYDLLGKAQRLRQEVQSPANFEASMLWRKTVGIVGFGKIAEAVARRLSTWDVRLLAHTRSDKPLPSYVERTSLDTLLSTSDVVVLLTSLNEETRHLIDSRRIALLKPDVVFVNTSRGAVVDEAALCSFAQQNPDVRLALDVFETEPLPADSPLRLLPNAVLTPHAIAGTREALAAIRKLAMENIASVLEGTPQNVRNPQVLTGWRERWGAKVMETCR